MVCGLTTPSWAEDEATNWDDAMSIDHFGYADGTATVNQGRFQIESGTDFASDASSTNWMARYGFTEAIELRFAVPALTASYSAPTKLQVDTMEAGFKYRVFESESIQLAILPYLILPAGSPVSSVETVSLGLKLLSDFSISDSIGVSLSAYPQLLGQSSGYVPNTAFAFSAGWSLSQRFSIGMDVWAEMVKSGDGFEPFPGADLAVMYLLTPNIALDLYVAAPLGEKELKPNGGFGLSFRL